MRPHNAASGRAAPTIRHYPREQIVARPLLKVRALLRQAERRVRRRLRRKTFDVVSLGQFRKSHSCPSIVCRAAETFETCGPQFIGDYDFSPAADHKISVRAPPLEIVEFTGAGVMGGMNLIFVGRQAIHPDVADPNQDMFLAEVEGIANFVARGQKLHVPGPSRHPTSPRKLLRVKEAVSLVGECTGNYAHWLIETLPKLVAVDEYEKYSSLPLLVDGWIHPIFYQTLALLNSRHRPIKRVNRWQMAMADRLVYITPPAYIAAENREYFLTGEGPLPSPDAFSFGPKELAALRVKAVAAAKKYLASGGTALRELPTITRIDCDDNPTAAIHKARKTTKIDISQSTVKKIYLRRMAVSAGNPRQLLGSDRVESILADFGFVAVDPAALTFAEQIMLLQNAECVVAPIGAALANLIFAPPGCKVIALAPYYRNADYYYFSNMMGALGHELHFVLGPQIDAPDKHLLHRDYMVDLQALKLALERLCR